VEFEFSVLSVVCYLGLLLGVSNVVGVVCGCVLLYDCGRGGNLHAFEVKKYIPVVFQVAGLYYSRNDYLFGWCKDRKK